MFDIGWSELLLIAIVALIVVGPKDLPGMFRTLGRFSGKMRAMARDFQRAMNEAAREAGVDEIGKAAGDIRKAASPTKMGLERLNEAADRFEKWDPSAALRKGARPAQADGSPATPATPATAASDSAAGGEAGSGSTGLSPERAEVARRIREHAAETAKKRIAAETAAARAGSAAGAAPAGGTSAPAAGSEAGPAAGTVSKGDTA